MVIWILLALLLLDVVLLWPGSPAAVAAAATLLGIALLPSGRRGFTLAVLIGLAIQMLLLGFLAPGPDAWQWGPMRFGAEGALRGLDGGLRLAGILAANVAVLRRVPPAVLADALPLPRRVQALVGAVVLAADDLARDARRLWDAQTGLEGAVKGLAAGRRAAALLPNILALAARRAHTRQEALLAAGIATRASFGPVVTVTALAILGRMPFVGLPNVALTYLLVFLGGLVWGPWAGFMGGLLGMALSDLLLSGLVPTAFVNAPAMALLGLAGGLLGRTQWVDSRSARLVAGAVGLVATIGFSVASDTATWLLVPEFRQDVAAWRALVLAGLAFNVVPAILNALLFAWAVGPMGHAFAVLRQRRFQA